MSEEMNHSARWIIRLLKCMYLVIALIIFVEIGSINARAISEHSSAANWNFLFGLLRIPRVCAGFVLGRPAGSWLGHKRLNL